MDYEKKNKDAISTIKQALRQLATNGVPVGNMIEAIKDIEEKYAESEDERIRKAIINFLHEGNPFKNIKKETRQRWISWLEKQGEKIDFANKEYWRGYRERKQEILDKYADFEKQGEQKSAEKVEPKFKVGDWIICCDYEPLQIINVRTSVYEMSNGDVRPFYMIDDNHNIRLWTIQDAKDGDVLSYRDGQWIFIFKKCRNDHEISYHALTSDKGLAINDVAFSVLEEAFAPATKEQREQLERVMLNAGYRWNKEKLKLEKV